MIVSSLLHGRLWQPYQRRCLRDDSRKLPAYAGRAAPSWRAMLCPEFAREKPALYTLRALCFMCSAGRKARGDMLVSSFLLIARPDTRYTLDSLARSLVSSAPSRHSLRRARTSRLSLPKNPVRQRDRLRYLLLAIAFGAVRRSSAARNRCVRQLSRWCGEKPPCA